MSAPSIRLRALFTLALVGTHAVIALALLRVSPLLAVGYLLATTTALTVLVLRIRAATLAAAAAESSGRTCTCCTTSVHDPVEVR